MAGNTCIPNDQEGTYHREKYTYGRDMTTCFCVMLIWGVTIYTEVSLSYPALP